MQQALIFVRVSKKEQDYQRQLEDLRAVVQTQSVQVMAEISEKISGVRNNNTNLNLLRRTFTHGLY